MSSSGRGTHIHGSAGAVVRKNNGTVIVGCPGEEHCPRMLDEAARQKRFEQNTGISCGWPEREALDYLLAREGFAVKDLALARKMSSLRLNVEQQRLEALPSRLELWYGRSLVMLATGSIALFTFAAVLSRDLPLLTVLQIALALSAFSFMAYVAQRFIVQPVRIAERVKPALERYYSEFQQQ